MKSLMRLSYRLTGSDSAESLVRRYMRMLSRASRFFPSRKKKNPRCSKSLKALVSIETGSRDFEGLGKLADLIAGRLKELGGRVELVEPSDVYKMEDTPEKIGKMVRATFTGKGTKKILLIAHMDTVYPRGMLAQATFPHRRRSGLRPGHRRQQTGHRGNFAHAGYSQSDRLPTTRYSHRPHQRRRGD